MLVCFFVSNVDDKLLEQTVKLTSQVKPEKTSTDIKKKGCSQMRGRRNATNFLGGGFLMEGKLLTNDRRSDYVVASRALTLRRLMSYIYMEHPFLMFLDHTQRRSTVGRTPLDE